MGNCNFSFWRLQFSLSKCIFIPFQICCHTKETGEIPLMSTMGSFPSTWKHGEISPLWIKIHPQSPSSSSSLPHLPILQKAKVLRKVFWLVLLSFYTHSPIQVRSVAQSCPALCYPMDYSTPGLPVHNQLLEPTQTHVHWVGDAIQPSHPL